MFVEQQKPATAVETAPVQDISIKDVILARIPVFVSTLRDRAGASLGSKNELILAEADCLLLKGAESMAVVNATDYEDASKVLDRLAEREKWMEEAVTGDAKGAAHKLHKAISGLEGELKTPFTTGIRSLKNRMLAWVQKDRLERERIKAQAEAELKRQADNEAVERAARLSCEGKHEEAAEVIAEAIATPAPEIILAAPAAPKGAASLKGKKKAKIVDEGAFYRALAERPELRIYAPADMSALNKQVGIMGDSITAFLPGVAAHLEEDIARSGRF